MTNRSLLDRVDPISTTVTNRLVVGAVSRLRGGSRLGGVETRKVLLQPQCQKELHTDKSLLTQRQHVQTTDLGVLVIFVIVEGSRVVIIADMKGDDGTKTPLGEIDKTVIDIGSMGIDRISVRWRSQVMIKGRNHPLVMPTAVMTWVRSFIIERRLQMNHLVIEYTLFVFERRFFSKKASLFLDGSKQQT